MKSNQIKIFTFEPARLPFKFGSFADWTTVQVIICQDIIKVTWIIAGQSIKVLKEIDMGKRDLKS